MSDKKISQLTELAATDVAPSTDVLVIVDTSATETKKITAKGLVDGALNTQTANGVLYLNGSKVATSGSALTFDGTNMGVGVATPQWPVDIQATSSALGLRIRGRASSNLAYLAFRNNANSADTVVLGGQDAGFTVDIAGSEGMRLTSTGLGIGTSSPWSQVSIGTPAGGTAGYFGVKDNTYGGDIRFGKASGVDNNAIAGAWSNNSFLFYTDSTERMRLDNSGNLGIGTSSPAFKLDVQGTTPAIRLKTAGVADGFKIEQSNATGNVELNVINGYPLIFKTTNTERMRLDSSGNLGIGTTSPSYKLQVGALGAGVQSGIYVPANFNWDGAYLQQATSGGRGAALTLASHTNISESTAYRISADNDSASRALVFSYAADSTTYAGASFTERMRLDSSGNLGLGVTPSTWASQIRALQVYGGTSYWAYNAGGVQIGGVYFNAYNDGAAKYSNTNRAASFEWGTNDGAFKWNQAASGTAGNAISFTQALTLNANGNLVLQGGSTGANGIGVTFPASQSASSDANCLDDYEEGTWTPIIKGGSTEGTATYANQSGTYVKIGRLVYIQCYLTWSSATGTGTMQIGNLPFNATSAPTAYTGISIGYWSNIAIGAGAFPSIHPVPGSNSLYLGETASGGGAWTNISVDAAGDIIIGGCYVV